MFQSKLFWFMDPEIVPGRTRGVKMGESSGKYYYLQVHDNINNVSVKIITFVLFWFMTLILLLPDEIVPAGRTRGVTIIMGSGK